MGPGFEMLGHLSFQDLVEDRLDQPGQGLFLESKALAGVPWVR
jgi:hypothetical protein